MTLEAVQRGNQSALEQVVIETLAQNGIIITDRLALKHGIAKILVKYDSNHLEHALLWVKSQPIWRR